MCRDDMEAVDLVDSVTQHKPGPQTLDNSKELEEYPTGTTRAYALRRLRKDRPDLHKQVLAGDLSPHAAMGAICQKIRQYRDSVSEK